ncbi:uncharacterized protein HKW66_Vig0214130 [Vigna angularis]|uniref:Uncharacterized protein n=3 Tax=Phaseolus angularis TaxID=3914 RepID=A0A8T0JDJ4_PHAAN|nr:uncharacterized protein HKW66_Vig0214130 [Vigna angularis]
MVLYQIRFLFCNAAEVALKPVFVQALFKSWVYLFICSNEASVFKSMGRGRGKGKKLAVINHEDPASGEDEKIPMQKRRGRPQKPLKDDFDEEEVEKIEDDSDNNVKNGISNKEMKSPTATENGRKRKKSSQVKEKLESVEEENGIDNGSNSTAELTKSNGFRHNGSRRKNTPRRAAEAGVQCK